MDVIKAEDGDSCGGSHDAAAGGVATTWASVGRWVGNRDLVGDVDRNENRDFDYRVRKYMQGECQWLKRLDLEW